MFGRIMGAAVAAAASMVVLAPAPANAAGHSVVFLSGSEMVIQSQAGGANWITIQLATMPNGIAAYAVRDNTAGATLTTVLPCQVTSTATVMCPRSSVTSYFVTSNDLNDTIQFPTLPLGGTVRAGTGDDFIEPGSGQDDLFGEAGTDWISYRTRTSPVSMTLDFSENDGAPLEHDLIGSDLEILDGGAGNDLLIGNAQAQRLHGNGGDDVLDGSLGSDSMFGGNGTDTVDYSARSNSVTVSVDSTGGDGEAGEDDWVPMENEVVIGGSGNDMLSGPVGHNTFLGSAGNDVLNGDTGNDTLDGGPGKDSLSGGTGNDLVSYENRTAPVTVTINGFANDGEAGEADNVKIDVENVVGGSGADKITGSNSANGLSGGPGNDQINAAGGNDNMDGGSGNDLAIGGSGNDIIDGGLGNDNIQGYAGFDLLRGDTGADSFAGGADSDEVSYFLHTSAVSATIDSIANDGSFGEGDNIKTDVEVLTGSGFGDFLKGSGDPETFYGGSGNDTLEGLGGADVLVGSEGADTLRGGTGTDTASYAERFVPVLVSLDNVANDGRPGISGEGDNVQTDIERVVGGFSNDVLLGSAGTNTLLGGAGDDVLDGGLGPDQLFGGDGFDVVTYGSRSAPITVRLDNYANDGQAGEADRIHPDVEMVQGGSGGDRLTGSARDDRLFGGPGDDFLFGLAGADVLDGQSGLDSLDGGEGSDFCTGETLTGCE